MCAGDTPLVAAAGAGHGDTVAALLRCGAGRDQDQVSITTVQLYSGSSNVGNVSTTQVAAAVRAAAAAGHQAAVARLLEAAPRLLVTAIVAGAERGQEQVTAWLTRIYVNMIYL